MSGPAIPIESIVFLDTETRHGIDDLKAGGAYRYSQSATCIILSYAIGLGPARAVWNIDGLGYGDLPAELRDALENPRMKIVAWNAGFDRAIWNYALFDSPEIEPERWLDASVQAAASNISMQLKAAAKRVGGTEKRESGAGLIKLFSKAGGPRPEQFPAAWDEFIGYALDDIESMRDIWQGTRQLPLEEWRVYWANERVNDRGIGIDMAYVMNAAELARLAGLEANRRLKLLTEGALWSINQHVALAAWVYDRLPDDIARDIMVTALPDLDDEDGIVDGDDMEAVQKLPSISIARGIVERLLDYLRAAGCDDDTLMEVLELREYGASNAPKKFASMLACQIGTRLRGMLVFNGAGQTGRFAGRLVQPQNLTRQTLGVDRGDDYGTYEAPTVDLITDGCTLEQLAEAEPKDASTLRKLALVVRPAIIAPNGKTLIKGDYKQIEARMTPFLAGNDRDALERLNVFRRIDADPKAPDSYRVTAGAMWGIPPEDVSSDQRQGGKISDLACGFGGAHNALMSMAAKYRLYFDEETARGFVQLWRQANPWAPILWGRHNDRESYGLMGAAMRAYQSPGTVQTAGLIAYFYDPGYLGGALFAILPSQRLLTYPWCRWRTYEKRDPKTKEVIEIKQGLTFLRANGLRAIWPGLLTENVVQAAAADLLRSSLVDMEERGIPVVLHAHDELVVEVAGDPDTIEWTSNCMTEIMCNDRGWAKGLPLAVDLTERFYYSSAKQRVAA